MIQNMLIKDIKPNADNPRVIKDDKFKKLVKSIKHFPKMLELRPIVIDENNTILGGNMRYNACIKAGLKEIPVIKINDLSSEQKKEFIIKDNVNFGEWDWQQIQSDWDKELLIEWAVDLPLFITDENDGNDNDKDIKINSLYQILIDFNSEDELKEAYDKLITLGYICKIMQI